LEIPLPVLPTFVFEDLFYNGAHTAVAFGREHLRLSFPCNIEFGLLEMRGVHLGITTEDIRGPVHATEAVCHVILPAAERDAVNAALQQFFDQVYDLSGYRRPKGLYGFPPGPPRP